VTQYALLFGTAFLASTILPLPSEAALALVVRQRGELVWPVLIATAGNFLGACTTYGLFRFAVRRVSTEAHPRWSRAAGLFGRFGAPSLLLSWLPIVGDAIVALAGAARMPLLAFSIWTVLGKAARYVLVAWVAG
jgi:membrane protein YqaA with SNARE-associated domain